MVNQMTDGNHRSEIGNLRQMLTDVVIEGELALLREQHDSEGGELLRHRPDIEHGLARHGYAVFDVGDPVCLCEYDLATANYRDHPAWSVVVLRHELIDPSSRIVRWALRRRR